MKLVPALLIVALIFLFSGGWGPLYTYAIVFYIVAVLIPWRLHKKLWKSSSSLKQPAPKKLHHRKTKSPLRKAASIIFLVLLSCFFLYLLIIIGFMEGRQRDPHLGYFFYGSVGFGVFSMAMYLLLNLLPEEDEYSEIDLAEPETANSTLKSKVEFRDLSATDDELTGAAKSEKKSLKILQLSAGISVALILIGLSAGQAVLSELAAANLVMILLLIAIVVHGVMMAIMLMKVNYNHMDNRAISILGVFLAILLYLYLGPIGDMKRELEYYRKFDMFQQEYPQL